MQRADRRKQERKRSSDDVALRFGLWGRRGKRSWGRGGGGGDRHAVIKKCERDSVAQRVRDACFSRRSPRCVFPVGGLQGSPCRPRMEVLLRDSLGAPFIHPAQGTHRWAPGP